MKKTLIALSNLFNKQEKDTCNHNWVIKEEWFDWLNSRYWGKECSKCKKREYGYDKSKFYSLCNIGLNLLTQWKRGEVHSIRYSIEGKEYQYTWKYYVKDGGGGPGKKDPVIKPKSDNVLNLVSKK